MTESPTLVYVVSVTSSGVALIGEAGKVAMISTYRFVAIGSAAHGLRISMRGEAGEVVALLVARRSSGFRVERVAATIDSDGLATIVIAA